ncbi:hypothetical protein [Sphingobium ummariense]
MSEPKPLASLTSGLLARKGAAQPAMRRPMLGFGRATGAAALQQDDLGWNDMGFDLPMPEPAPADSRPSAGLTPMPGAARSVTPPPVPAVVTEREVLAERVEQFQPARSGRKAAFTLRLDADRHLKLRLACAIAGKSAQQMVTQALDAFLDSQPDVARLAQQLPPERGETK